MKVIAINASPRGSKSCTDKILHHLLEGINQTGAETETIYLANKKIHHCIGCFTCWLKTPGKCVFEDDMNPILEKFVDADLVIYGTPLYCFTMTGLLKNFFAIHNDYPVVTFEIFNPAEGLKSAINRHSGSPREANNASLAMTTGFIF